MFDFDQLSECEEETAAPESDGGRSDSRTSGAETAQESEDMLDLQRRCQGHGLCIAWGPEKQQMVAMLSEVEEWGRFGICALKEECGKRRIPMEGLYERRDVLSRLCDVLVWQQMSLKQLQSECWRRRIPYIPQKRVSHIILLETENPHADEHEDLLRRLMQDAFPGSHGPLPAGGIAGVWTPGSGSFAGGERLPAWTGERAPGFEGCAATRPTWQAPSGVPFGSAPRAKPRPEPQRPAGPKAGLGGAGAAGAWSRAFPDLRESEEHPAAEHFRSLGLQSTATMHEVRRAYHQLALKYHPDKSKDQDDTKFKMVF